MVTPCAVLGAVPAYAVQRLLLQASSYTFGPAAMAAIIFLVEGHFRDASISAGVAVACFCYFMAFYERRDLDQKP
jgi:hypothetical protein